jgi:uncharacterized cupin superfamily protein
METTMAANTLKAPALDPAAVKVGGGKRYPDKFKPLVAGRSKQALGDALGLANFGVNLTRLKPGAASAARHWHSKQDEFVWIVEGEATLVTDAGAQVLKAGQCAGFPAGKADGHHLVNRSARDVVYLEIGDRSPGDASSYPDDDLHAVLAMTYKMTKKDGSSY